MKYLRGLKFIHFRAVSAVSVEQKLFCRRSFLEGANLNAIQIDLSNLMIHRLNIFMFLPLSKILLINLLITQVRTTRKYFSAVHSPKVLKKLFRLAQNSTSTIVFSSLFSHAAIAICVDGVELAR